MQIAQTMIVQHSLSILSAHPTIVLPSTPMSPRQLLGWTGASKHYTSPSLMEVLHAVPRHTQKQSHAVRFVYVPGMKTLAHRQGHIVSMHPVMNQLPIQIQSIECAHEWMHPHLGHIKDPIDEEYTAYGVQFFALVSDHPGMQHDIIKGYRLP